MWYWKRLLRVLWTTKKSNKLALNIHWKDWCWDWSSNTLATWFKEQTHYKRPWCWKRLKAVPYDPAILLLGIHTEETRIERSTCIPMFITALFTIARTWKQPRCPSADEWIRKLWYIYTMEYYSVIKKNALESVLMRWMKLEPIIQRKTAIQYINAYIWNLERW